MQEHLKFYIDGAWVPPVKPATLDVINPATEKPIAQDLAGQRRGRRQGGHRRARARSRRFSRTTREERLALLQKIVGVYQTQLRRDREDDLERDGRADLAVEGRAGRDRHRATSCRRSRC